MIEKTIAFNNRIEALFAFGFGAILDALISPRFIRAFRMVWLIAFGGLTHGVIDAGESGHTGRFIIMVIYAFIAFQIVIQLPAKEDNNTFYLTGLPLFDAMPRYRWERLPYGQYVYIIQDVSVTRFCKIGKTVSVPRRLAEFKVLLPFEHHVVAILPCRDALALESRLHRLMSRKRVNGEWFAIDQNDLKAILGDTE